jgi:ribonuclease HI
MLRDGFLMDGSFKDECSDLLKDGVEVEIMWISSHAELEGNNIVNERARHVALNGAVFD